MASSRTHEGSLTYLIQGEQGGPIKIGLSNPAGFASRLASLQTGYPYRLRVLQSIEGNHEADLHHRFGHLRLHGEWFSPGEDLVAFCGPDALSEERTDYRAGFEAGFAAATTEMQVRMHRAFEAMDEPYTLSLALEEASRLHAQGS